MIRQTPNQCMGNQPLWQKAHIALRILKNPWMLLADKLGFNKTPEYETVTGIKFRTRGGTTDINDAVVVLSGNEYPKELLQIDTEQPVILDCGGHIGTFTLYLKNLYPQAKVFILEPVQNNIQYLQANLDLNKTTDVTIINHALYGSAGKFYIDLSNKQFDAVSLSSTKPANDEYIEVDALTLDQVLQQNNISRVDLMKLDIEGAEYNVFEHSLAVLNQSIRHLIMEFHPAGDKDRRDYIVNRLCNDGSFELVYETKNILGFKNRTI